MESLFLREIGIKEDYPALALLREVCIFKVQEVSKTAHIFPLCREVLNPQQKILHDFLSNIREDESLLSLLEEFGN